MGTSNLSMVTALCMKSFFILINPPHSPLPPPESCHPPPGDTLDCILWRLLRPSLRKKSAGHFWLPKNHIPGRIFMSCIALQWQCYSLLARTSETGLGSHAIPGQFFIHINGIKEIISWAIVTILWFLVCVKVEEAFRVIIGLFWQICSFPVSVCVVIWWQVMRKHISQGEITCYASLTVTRTFLKYLFLMNVLEKTSSYLLPTYWKWRDLFSTSTQWN